MRLDSRVLRMAIGRDRFSGPSNDMGNIIVTSTPLRVLVRRFSHGDLLRELCCPELVSSHRTKGTYQHRDGREA